MTLDEITGGSPYERHDDRRRRWLAAADGERAPGSSLPGPQDRGDRKQAARIMPCAPHLIAYNKRIAFLCTDQKVLSGERLRAAPASKELDRHPPRARSSTPVWGIRAGAKQDDFCGGDGLAKPQERLLAMHHPQPAKSIARPAMSVALRYGLALVSVSVAFVLAQTFLYYGLPQPFTAFALSAIASTFWYGGTKPGILAALISWLVRDYFFEPEVSAEFSHSVWPGVPGFCTRDDPGHARAKRA